jgi:hypothetical protein
MIDAQKVMQELICPLSVGGQPTKAVLAQTCTGVLIIHCLIQFMQCFFFQNRLRTAVDVLANRHEPQFEKH